MLDELSHITDKLSRALNRKLAGSSSEYVENQYRFRFVDVDGGFTHEVVVDLTGLKNHNYYSTQNFIFMDLERQLAPFFKAELVKEDLKTLLE